MCNCYNCLVEFLINKGADVNVKDNLGETPLALAKEYECNDVVDILVRNGAK